MDYFIEAPENIILYLNVFNSQQGQNLTQGQFNVGCCTRSEPPMRGI